MADRVDKTYAATYLTVVRSEGPQGALADGAPSFTVTLGSGSAAKISAKEMRAFITTLEAALVGA